MSQPWHRKCRILRQSTPIRRRWQSHFHFSQPPTLAKGFLRAHGWPKIFKKISIFLSISTFYVPISHQQLQVTDSRVETYDPSQEKIHPIVLPLSTCRIYIGVSPTHSVLQAGSKSVTQYQFCALWLQHLSQLPFLFVLSVVKCGRIMQGTDMRTLRHRAIQVGQAVSTLSIKNFEKFTFFSIISGLYVPISQQLLKQSYTSSVRTFLTVPVLPVKTP